MAKKKLTPQQEREIEMLKKSNAMYEKTKKEMQMRNGENTATYEEVLAAQADIQAQLKKIDEDADLTPLHELKHETVSIKEDTKSVFDKISDIENKEKKQTQTSIANIDKIEETVLDSTAFNSDSFNVQYDIIPLPSNGECYKSKINRIPVSYLTAYDENFITSPNLYRDGLVIDFLLKNKVVDPNINVEELLSGDVDAIMLFLRTTSYGPDFPVSVRDPKTNQYIETSIDLSKIKVKPFKLKGDENGYFDYTVESTKDVIKFKYLTRKEEKLLEKLAQIESSGAMVLTLKNIKTTLTNCINSDTVLTREERELVFKEMTRIDNWVEKLEEKHESIINKTITNRMEMQIISVNGNTNREFIRNYIHSMRAGDSLKLRRYIMNNEPGVDFEVEVQRPENLGGGSFKTFLEWDDNVFLNIT